MGLLKTGLKAVVAVKTADVIHERIIQGRTHSGPRRDTPHRPPRRRRPTTCWTRSPGSASCGRAACWPMPSSTRRRRGSSAP